MVWNGRIHTTQAAYRAGRSSAEALGGQKTWDVCRFLVSDAHTVFQSCKWLYSQTVGHEHTRTGNWFKSGFGSLRGAPLNITRCLGGGSRCSDPMAALRAGPPPPMCRTSQAGRIYSCRFRHASSCATALAPPEAYLLLDAFLFPLSMIKSSSYHTLTIHKLSTNIFLRISSDPGRKARHLWKPGQN